MSCRSKPFQQFFKLFPLFRRELLANLLPDILQPFVKLRRNIGPNFVVAFLAVGDDFGNCSTLFRREMKRLVKLLHELLAEYFRRTRFGQILWIRLVVVAIIRLWMRVQFTRQTLNIFWMRLLHVIDQQTAGQHTCAKNHHCRQNDFP